MAIPLQCALRLIKDLIKQGDKLGDRRYPRITPMTMTLRDMSQAECMSTLEESRFGHLACSKDGQPYVVPIYFAYEKGVAYSFSMPGRKIDWMRENDKVCLQVDRMLGGKG
jgi:nitroimidazol reductase NimA-like FMN-containing flavoprotein (pyridoxamine 5'-phosphate oxidase superfamily)